ncbi:MAG TPA: hypothetical protein VF941_05550, partial [Clostridia bacterium]
DIKQITRMKQKTILIAYHIHNLFLEQENRTKLLIQKATAKPKYQIYLDILFMLQYPKAM